LTDHVLVIEVEAAATAGMDLRLILNINSLDSTVVLDQVNRFEVHRFAVPVIKLREDNPLRMIVNSNDSSAVFKLRRMTILLENKN